MHPHGDLAARRAHMLRHDLRARGITDERVLGAMAAVPRERFVPESHRAAAYEDRALPVGEGQTISQPFIVAFMLDGLALKPVDSLLEVGAGTGYAAAVASRLCRAVVGIERVHRLAIDAAERLHALGYDTVRIVEGDGSLGWPDAAPYDAILVSAGGPAVPPALLAQLAPAGRLVMPIGRRRAQHLERVVRTATGFTRDDLGGVAFVPLIGEQGWTATPDG